MKVCRGCQEEKPLDQYPVRKDRSGRLRPYCRECARDAQRARYKAHKRDNYFLHKCTRARSRAQHLKVPFNLTPEYLKNLWTGYCPIIHVEIRKETDRSDEFAAELDRYTPDLGYIKGNVAFISRKMNRIKNNTSIEELQKLLEWMKWR